MTQTTPSNPRHPGRRAASLIALALLAVLWCHAGVGAQSAPSGPAGGDLSGTYPNPGLAVDRVRKAGDTMTGALNISLPNPGTVITPFTITSGGNALLNRGTAMGFNVPHSGANLLGGKITTAWGSLAQTFISFNAYNQGAFNEVFRADGRGFFGIGIANPTSKLHVASGTDSVTTMLHLDTGVHGGTAMAVGGNAANESTFEMSVQRGGVYTSRFGVTAAGNVFLQPGVGNVGVGTTTPAYRLDVRGGQLNAQNGLCIAGDCKVSWGDVVGVNGGTQWTTNGSNITYNSGNVGIGTLNPTTYKLDVAGQVRSSSGGFVFPDGTVQATASVGTITGVTAGGGLTGGGAAGSVMLNIGAGTGLTVAPDSISVNYGSTAGTAVQGNTTLTVSPGDGMTGGGSVTLGTGGALTLTNGDRGSAQNIFKTVSNAAGAAQFSAGSNNDALRFEGMGGTSVSFDVDSKKVTITSPTVAASGWTDGGASVRLTDPAASVGIGTASPGHSLEVAKAVTGDFNGLHVYNAAGSPYNAGDSASLSLGRSDIHVMGKITASNRQAGTFGDGYLAFSTRREEVVAERVRIDEEGRVGIGTQTPTQKLHVEGNIHASGSINAKYQDVAEWVPSTQELAAGTVVVLDSTRSNHVLASSEAYDTRVAGVVSARPGLLLGEGGKGKVMVATTGRVRVKVDATRTPIKIGDLLVTSGAEGTAMKSLPVDLGGTPIHRPGTIIGKALEPLEKGVGEVLVLLSLQ